MRSIDVSIEVFSLIWGLRRPPESTESEILQRVLQEYAEQMRKDPGDAEAIQPADINRDLHANRPEVKTSGPVERFEVKTSKAEGDQVESSQHGGDEMFMGKVRWVDDVQAALYVLGGEASLHEIYKKVREIRSLAGRSIPRTLEATIRRTLEDHCRESNNFKSVALFRMPYGPGAGVWALIKKIRKKDND